MNELEDKLKGLVRRHDRDHDGGYALFWDLAAALESTGESERPLVIEWLVRRVNGEEPAWAVAMDVLAHARSTGAAQRLLDAIDSGKHSEEWEHHVLFGLLRMRYAGAKERYVAHIEERIASRPDEIGTMIAALAAVDQDACIRLALLYFQTWLGKREGIGNLLPSYLIYFLETDANLFARLLRELSVREPAKSIALAEMLLEETKKPWQVKKFGSEILDRVAQSIRASVSARVE